MTRLISGDPNPAGIGVVELQFHYAASQSTRCPLNHSLGDRQPPRLAWTVVEAIHHGLYRLIRDKKLKSTFARYCRLNPQVWAFKLNTIDPFISCFLKRQTTYNSYPLMRVCPAVIRPLAHKNSEGKYCSVWLPAIKEVCYEVSLDGYNVT